MNELMGNRLHQILKICDVNIYIDIDIHIYIYIYVYVCICELYDLYELHEL